MTDIDNYNADADTVVMMTVHSAKGLEFPTVFLAGMEESIFPSDMSRMGGNEQVEEERRLAYVGITRAKRQLYLTRARTRMLSARRNSISRHVLSARSPRSCLRSAETISRSRHPPYSR